MRATKKTHLHPYPSLASAFPSDAPFPIVYILRTDEVVHLYMNHVERISTSSQVRCTCHESRSLSSHLQSSVPPQLE